MYIYIFIRDGTSKLWYIANGTVIDDLIKLNPTTYINCCSISSPKNLSLGERNIPACKKYILIKLLVTL